MTDVLDPEKPGAFKYDGNTVEDSQQAEGLSRTFREPKLAPRVCDS